MGSQRGNVQAIVQNICLWAVLGTCWPQACALCSYTSHSHMPPKNGKA